MLIENVRFVIKNANKCMFYDKKNIDFTEEDRFNLNTYKYINDQLLPQIINSQLKYNPTMQLNDLKARAEVFPEIKKYCQDLEEQIEKDCKVRLNDHYYTMKNKNLANIFSKPPNLYERKNKLNGLNNLNSNSKNSRDINNNNNTGNSTSICGIVSGNW